MDKLYKAILALSLVLWSEDSLAQAGCSDAGVCTIGGHSTEELTEAGGLSARVIATTSENSQYSFQEIIPKVEYDLDLFSAEASVNYRIINAKYSIVRYELSPSNSPGGKQPPKVQHVTMETNTIETHYALGDLRLGVSVPLSAIGEGVAVQASYSFPLTDLYQDRPQDMQSTLGLPAAIVGVSYDAGDSSLRYGGTVGYYSTFGKQSTLHLTRADDIAAALRIAMPLRYFDGGVDLNAIYHVDDDKLHGIPTSRIEGYETTKGLTVNLGLSASKEIGKGKVGLFAAVPILGIAHVDGLKRSYVAGVFGAVEF